MGYTAAVITVSDRGARGERADGSGPALEKILSESGWSVEYRAIVPDEPPEIRAQLVKCADRLDIALILTTGGTGFSPRDVTPEATLSVVERQTPGIPELMRAESMRITPRGCLSRAAAGIRGGSLIVNLPGSEKAARECLAAVLEPIAHGIEMLRGGPADCAAPVGKVLAVCVSEKKGEQKHPIDEAELVPDMGIPGDAHAGNWHRQVSLLANESVDKLRGHLDIDLKPGDFAENILTEGICLYELPVGTKLRLGTALCQVTQIGKECHKGCAIREKTGDCVMPREGIFVRVLEKGRVKAGDMVTPIID